MIYSVGNECSKDQEDKTPVVILLIAIFAGGGEDSSNTTEPATATEAAEINYVQYDLAAMFDELENNAMVAEETYTDEFYLTGMMCYFKDDEQREVVKSKGTDQ